MENLVAIILAAGEGKRMKSKKAKVTHKICGKALVECVYNSAVGAGADECVVVIGHGADQVRECLGEKVTYAVQEEQLGTGHAVKQAESFLKGRSGYALLLCGDTPLITAQTLASAVKYHKDNCNSATVITADMENPYGYGRIIRDEHGNLLKIVEHRDATDEEKAVKEINSGMYCFTIAHLLEALNEINNNNDQGEYYITDTIEILLSKGLKVGAMKICDSSEIMGINDRVQLAEASNIMKKRIIVEHMKAGVTIIDPSTTYIDLGVEIGSDTVIYPGTMLQGSTCIGEDCEIGPNTRIVDSAIGNGCDVVNSVVIESTVGTDTHIGPFAYIRPQSSIGSNVKIGDFVEIKKSVIGDRTKISHLTYIGDAELGKNINVGCGVVVVNYDGKKKNKTIVGDNAFIGCNSNLVSPVVIKDNAYIAAGSTITEDVPEYSLAIARERQVIKENWVIKKGMERK